MVVIGVCFKDKVVTVIKGLVLRIGGRVRWWRWGGLGDTRMPHPLLPSVYPPIMPTRKLYLLMKSVGRAMSFSSGAGF